MFFLRVYGWQRRRRCRRWQAQVSLIKNRTQKIHKIMFGVHKYFFYLYIYEPYAFVISLKTKKSITRTIYDYLICPHILLFVYMYCICSQFQLYKKNVILLFAVESRLDGKYSWLNYAARVDRGSSFQFSRIGTSADASVLPESFLQNIYSRII